MNLEQIQKRVDKVNKIFREQECGYEVEFLEGYNYVCVEIDGGDWKHDHLFTEHIMNENGFKSVGERLTYEYGSDWYGSIHYFKVPTE